jgi:predicted kinase
VIRSDETRKAISGVDPLQRLRLDAPEVLIARSEQRRLDASDADADVIRQQLAHDLGAMAWRGIDASPALDDVLRTATAVLSERLKSGVIQVASQAA